MLKTSAGSRIVRSLTPKTGNQNTLRSQKSSFGCIIERYMPF